MSIPGGYVFWQPEIRFSAPKGFSLRQVAQALVVARLGNPAITAKLGWSTDIERVVVEVETYNAQVLQMRGLSEYVIPDARMASSSAPVPVPFRPAPQPKAPLLSGVKNVAVGANTIKEMFGDDGLVDPALANARAKTCVACPMNTQRKNWIDLFIASTAALLRRVLETFKSMNLKTDLDDELGVCAACDCPMRLKVWAKLSHINKHMPAEQRAKLHKDCWVLSESK